MCTKVIIVVVSFRRIIWKWKKKLPPNGVNIELKTKTWRQTCAAIIVCFILRLEMLRAETVSNNPKFKPCHFSNLNEYKQARFDAFFDDGARNKNIQVPCIALETLKYSMHENCINSIFNHGMWGIELPVWKEICQVEIYHLSVWIYFFK